MTTQLHLYALNHAQFPEAGDLILKGKNEYNVAKKEISMTPSPWSKKKKIQTMLR